MDQPATLICYDPDCDEPAKHMTSAPKTNGDWVIVYLCRPHYRELAPLLKEVKERLKTARKRQPQREGELPALWELA